MANILTITRTFAAPRELVYEAWTKPEHFSVWFGTEAVDVPLDSLSMDVRIGGKWNAVMVLPDGNKIFWEGEYTEVDPPKRLALTITDNPGEPAGDPLTVDFAEVDGGTEMTMKQNVEGFTEEGIEGLKQGYAGFFDDMEKVIAKQN